MMSKFIVDGINFRTVFLLFGICCLGSSQLTGPVRINCVESTSSNQVTRTCFDDYNVQKTWPDAWAHCASMSSQLATISTPEINAIIGKYMDGVADQMNENEEAWIGGHELNLPDWHWLGERTFHFGNNSSDTVIVDLTTTIKPFDTCAAVSSTGSTGPSVLHFQSFPCVRPSYFICQNKFESASGSTTCQIGPYNGVVHDDSCYATVLTKIATWYDARNECIQYGADLAVFDESRDHDVIASLLPPGNQSVSWVGLRRYPWGWATAYNQGTQNVDHSLEMTFTDWMTSNPNYNDKSCMAMRGQGGAGHGWVNLGCNFTTRFICQQTTISVGNLSIQVIDVNLTHSSPPAKNNNNNSQIVNIVVPCAIVAVVLIVIGFTIYCYFSKRQAGYAYQH